MNILITGASSGIGLGLAKAYLNENHQVYTLSRTKPKIEHPEHHFQACDFSDLENSSKVLEHCFLDIQDFDLLILNAGILGNIEELQKTSTQNLQRMMDINLWSNKVLIDIFLKRKIKQVIAISSGASVNGNKGWGGYSISKAALNMMIKVYGAEHPDTHFLAFAPGLVDTAMQDQLCSMDEDQTFPSLQKLKTARGTENMPTPDVFAERFIKLLPTLKNYPSGSFQDIRKLEL